MTPKRDKPTTSAKRFDRYFNMLDQAQQALTHTGTLRQPDAAKVDIEEEIAREQKIKNDDAEQDIRLKRNTLERLFAFLLGETIVLFLFAFLQATAAFNFRLEEWSFKLLTAATITQITIMLLVAVKYLFPRRQG